MANSGGATRAEDSLWQTGPILEAVQAAGLYPDSKEFVYAPPAQPATSSYITCEHNSEHDIVLTALCPGRDMPLKVAPAVALAAFAQLPQSAAGMLLRPALCDFVEQHFDAAGRCTRHFVCAPVLIRSTCKCLGVLACFKHATCSCIVLYIITLAFCGEPFPAEACG